MNDLPNLDTLKPLTDAGWDITNRHFEDTAPLRELYRLESKGAWTVWDVWAGYPDKPYRTELYLHHDNPDGSSERVTVRWPEGGLSETHWSWWVGWIRTIPNDDGVRPGWGGRWATATGCVYNTHVTWEHVPADGSGKLTLGAMNEDDLEKVGQLESDLRDCEETQAIQAVLDCFSGDGHYTCQGCNGGVLIGEKCPACEPELAKKQEKLISWDEITVSFSPRYLKDIPGEFVEPPRKPDWIDEYRAANARTEQRRLENRRKRQQQQESMEAANQASAKGGKHLDERIKEAKPEPVYRNDLAGPGWEE